MERRRKYESDWASQNACTALSLSKNPKITLYNSQRDLSISLPQVRRTVSFLLKELKISTDELIIHFVSQSEICRLHKAFFNDPSVTDCITFPIDPIENKDLPFHVLGEVFICPKTAIEYSRNHKVSPLEELNRYIIHCLLHLIGYNDLKAQDRERMKRKERACLKKLFKQTP